MIAIRSRLGITTDVWIVAAVGGAWSLALFALLTGRQAVLDHDAILHRGTPPGPVDFLLFFAAWQVMTAAMMLPSSVPMMRLFLQISRGQEHPRLAFGVFLVAYFVVWTEFAVGALLVDSGVHALVDRWAWLEAHPGMIAGALLAIAGAFQFSPLKEQCLRECRSPRGFLWRYYQRGTWNAWRLGVRHGWFCLGCCWALMLLMFGVGVGSLVWMTALTGVMVIEKTTRWGHRLVPYVGIGLFVAGLIVMSSAGIGVSIPVGLL